MDFRLITKTILITLTILMVWTGVFTLFMITMLVDDYLIWLSFNLMNGASSAVISIELLAMTALEAMRWFVGLFIITVITHMVCVFGERVKQRSKEKTK